ncbi:O-antigen ligase family protein [Legionella sp. D16C41]|uniref:O-antigen ligase family protein n=1 Tax=Legionella sp. D16C41 TaxID=3402688 RepID=UPI003AF61C14
MAIAQLTWSKYALKDVVTFLLAGLLFTIPISSSGKSIFAVLTIASILMFSEYRLQIKHVLGQAWCRALLVFVGLTLVACFWSPADIKVKLFVLEKYSKLLYLPIFLVGFRNKQVRLIGLHAFLVAMALTALLSIGKKFNILTLSYLDADQVFRNHIMTSMMMVFATYLSGYLLFRQKGNLSRFFYGSLVIIYSYQILFINASRLGYLLYAILMILLIIQMLNWRQAMIGIVSVLLFWGLAYKVSSTMQIGVNALSDNFKYFQQSKNTSIGFRLQFHSYAKNLFERHPLIGNGTGSFIHYFKKEDPIPAWGHKLLEPHSQYWLIAAEFGVIGLLIFAAFYCFLLKEALQLKEWRFAAIALLVSIAVGNLSDSLLFYSGSGYFFLVLMALFLSEKQDHNNSNLTY